MRTSLPPGQTLTLHDMQMYYLDAGEGEPLLLLHGYTGASTDWAFCFDELASQYRLIIPDLRGHGRSTNPSGEYRQRQAARDVQALLDHLGIGSFQGIGASGGGNILLHRAPQQLERVEAMVLMSAVSYYPEQARKIMRSYTLEQVSDEERQRLQQRHPRGDEQIQELFRLGSAFAEQYDDRNFTPPSLSTITARTLLIFGDRDPFYPVSIALDMHKAIARSSLWIVPNGGHVPDLNAPFVPSLLPFLRGEWKREEDVESSTSLLLFLFVPNAALLSLSACVGHREADGARPITGSLRPLFGMEEGAVVHIAIRSNGTQHGGAVKTTIDAVAAVSTQYSWHSTGVWFVVGADKSPELAHVYRPIFPFPISIVV